MARSLEMNMKLRAWSPTDPTDAQLLNLSYADTPENVEIHHTTVGTSSMNISIAGFPTGATIDYLIVQNMDATNYVTVTFTNAAGASIANRVGAGKYGVFPDVVRSATPTIQANTAACLCRIILIGDDAEA
jgi:hypothetical protein